MTDPTRGPTTEELRARVLAQLAEDARLEAREAFSEGRSGYDPDRGPLDNEKGERLGSPVP